MVVIAIIGVVFGVIISSTNQVKKNARDGQRQSDLAKIQSALQSYYGDQSAYPLNNTVNSGGSIANGSITYLNPIPYDPTGISYCYIAYTSPAATTYCTDNSNPSTACNYYQLFTNMENSGNISPNNNCGRPENYMVTSP